MSIAAGARCLQCYLERSMDLAWKLGNEEQATRFMRALMQEMLHAPQGVSAPWFAPKTAVLLHEIYGLDLDRYKEEKEASNAYVLERLPVIRRAVEESPEPLRSGLQHAILGNYIDFSALRGAVSFAQLDNMLKKAPQLALDEQTYSQLCEDLQKGKRLLYITDNAGELGFDRIFAEQIAKAYPHLQITFMVRGGPANNDALRADAQQMQLPFPVIDNGNCIPGTQLDQLSEDAMQAMNHADVILSKGQGNVETLYGCGYNVYYAFLIKCQRFVELFGQPPMTPMLLREQK